MSDAPGPPHPLGIEAVHWSSGTGSDLLVRVAGRWRRRRTPTSAQPVLAIDTELQRFRFPALAEPPSVRGAQPGLWQVSFTIPASLAPYLSGRLTLMLGSVSISLPPAVSDPGEVTMPVGAGGALPEAPEAIVLDRRRRHAELAEPEPRPRPSDVEAANGEATALLDWLELELMQARRETGRLRSELEVAERRRRDAEQLAHAEAAMRLELGQAHAVRIRRHQADACAVLELLQAVQIHARGLAQEIETLRRSADEAGQPSRSTRAPGDRPGSTSRARALATELALARSTPPAPVAAHRLGPVRMPGLALELAMQGSRAARSAPTPLGRRRAVGAPLEGVLLLLAAERAQAGDLLAPGPGTGDELADDRARAAYASQAIEAIARQLDAVRAVVALLPPEVTHDAEVLARAATRGGAAPPDPRDQRDPPDQRADPVAPDRLAAALHRLREENPEPEPAPASAPGAALRPPADRDPAPAVSLAAELAAARERAASFDTPPEAARSASTLSPVPPRAPAVAAMPVPAAPRTRSPRWLLRALKRLLREDPALVGTMVLRLLPAQSLVVAGPVRYDIVLDDGGCWAVSVRDDEVRVEVLATPRPLDEVDFRIEGDLAGLGRLLLYRPLRRRLSRRVARVRGERRAFAALEWLVREPVGLHALHASGVRLDPELALTLVAYMIDPSWTAGERFTIGHEAPGAGGRAYLLVRDGARPRVAHQPPLGPVATTIRCSDERLLPLLTGGDEDEVALRGAAEPVALVRAWIARAQRDS